MITWKQAQIQSGFEEFCAKPFDGNGKKTVWHVFMNDGTVETRATLAEAEAVGGASIKQHTFCTPEYLEWKEEKNALARASFDLWFNKLRAEYQDLPQDVFDLCYNRAYSDSHSSGWDGVAEEMTDVVDFVYRIKQCYDR